MDKKLLAAAVAAAMFAPAVASADVTVYGRVQVEYNVEDSDASGADSVQGVDDDAGQSRIGFKFKEKLGGGLTAFGKVEFNIDPSDANSSSGAANGQPTPSTADVFNARDQHVGIKGSWGSIAAGSFHSPYKTAGGVKWDAFNATHLQARRAGGMTGGPGIGGHNGFMRNAIYYTSPTVNGFKVQFAISPDETNAAGTHNESDESDNDYSVAAHYKNGPWHAIVAHNRNNEVTGTDDETLTKVGLRWKSGPWDVKGHYEWVDDSTAVNSGSTPGIAGNYRIGGGDDGEVLYLQGSYKAGNNIFVATYGNTDVDGAGAQDDYEYDFYTLGVIHKFSKKTRIFGGYSATDGDNAGGNANANDRDVWSVGIRKDF